MKTVTIITGNTDNKLPQRDWCSLCARIDEWMNTYCSVHFSAPSVGWAKWQNAAWVATIEDGDIDRFLKPFLAQLCRGFNQESIALVIGESVMVTGGEPNPAST